MKILVMDYDLDRIRETKRVLETECGAVVMMAVDTTGLMAHIKSAKESGVPFDLVIIPQQGGGTVWVWNLQDAGQKTLLYPTTVYDGDDIDFLHDDEADKLATKVRELTSR